MNKYQRLVVATALMNMLAMVLFPPFASQPLAKGSLPSFEGFYPLVTQLGSKPLYKELLTLELMFVIINTLTAWLILQKKKHPTNIPDFAFGHAIGWFAAINLAIIFTFPPFEPYPSLLRTETGEFDSFYFILGHRSQRAIFWPLLYLECMLVIINALGHLLLFSAIKRGDDKTRRKLMQLTGDLPDEAIQEIAENSRHMIEAKHSHNSSTLGRGPDRRRAKNVRIKEERRSGTDRRNP